MDKGDNFQKSRKMVLFESNIQIFGCGQKYTLVYIIICIEICRKNEICANLPLKFFKNSFSKTQAERALPVLPVFLLTNYICTHIRN